jgi:hypothetical protein
LVEARYTAVPFHAMRPLILSPGSDHTLLAQLVDVRWGQPKFA